MRSTIGVHGLVAAAVVLVVYGGAGAQSVSLADETSRRIDQVFSRWTAQTPGCVVGIAQSGQTVYTAAYGIADLQHKVPLQSASIFHVASISKQVTATVIGLLAADGRISLDDDVRKYVPELPDYGHRVTLRQLIQHTSGCEISGIY